jgi:hypothetical protein
MEKITANRRELDAKEARAFFGNFRKKHKINTKRRKNGILSTMTEKRLKMSRCGQF